jgi:hypothetical protein
MLASISVTDWIVAAAEAGMFALMLGAYLSKKKNAETTIYLAKNRRHRADGPAATA